MQAASCSVTAAHLELTIDHQPIRQPAGLSTLAPVGGAPAPGLAAEALPAVADTQGAMTEGLYLRGAGGCQGADFTHAQLAPHHHPCYAQLWGRSGAGC